MQNTNTESPKWESIVEVKWQTIRDGCALRGETSRKWKSYTALQ